MTERAHQALRSGCALLAAASLAALAYKQISCTRSAPPAPGGKGSDAPPEPRSGPSLSTGTSTTSLPPPALSSPYTATHTHTSWLPPRRDKAGVLPDLTLLTTLPYPLSIGGAGTNAVEQTIATCEVYRSAKLTDRVFDKLRATRLSGTENTYFSDVVSVILNKGGSRVYVYGGYVRDLIVGKDAADVDFLFRSSGGSVVPFLLEVARERGWAPHRKIDEGTGAARWDFISVGDRSESDGGSKFTGHPLYASCEGEFTCNTLLYDIHSGVLIDPTGNGVKDAVNYTLRVPLPRGGWESWLQADRLVGMKLLRYFNFCSRGYTPYDEGESSELRGFVVARFRQLTEGGQMGAATEVFCKRKVFRGPEAGHAGRERAFRNAVVEEMAKAPGGGAREGAERWYLQHVVPRYPEKRVRLDFE